VSIHSCGIGHNQGPALGHDDADDALDAQQAAAFLGIAIVTLWRQVDRGDLPRPFYAAPRAPRWTKGELRLAREARRMLPRDAKAARRAARITAKRETTNAAET
jgi:predicted DNA-binding transcriptional regulator AlpA